MSGTENWQQYTVTAGQLRGRLAGVPDDTPVILSRDAEGNGYSPLSSVDTEDRVYEPESTWSGTVYDTRPDPDDEDGYIPEGGTSVVLLGPVN